MKKMLAVHVERCIACHSCEMACAVAHSATRNLAEAVTEEPRPAPLVHVEQAGELAAPMQCRHCENAPCAVVCPKDALHRPSAESPVLLDPELCSGCKFCLLACPYGVIHIPSDRKVAVKCDLCIARTEAGELPACVEACPTGALEYADVDDDFLQRAAAFAEGVLADAAAHAESVDAEQKSVNCEVCGCLVAPRKQIELMRKKLSENVPVANTCYRCRRSRAAQLLAEMCEQPVAATEE